MQITSCKQLKSMNLTHQVLKKHEYILTLHQYCLENIVKSNMFDIMMHDIF
jgi:hypothetical protein